MKPVIWLLAFATTFLVTWHFAIDSVAFVTAADVQVQSALNRAVRGAAEQTSAASPRRIDTTRGAAVFYNLLASNLGLDPNTLQPLAGSPLPSKPEVRLIIYNGPSFPFDYEARPGVRVHLTAPGVVAVLDGRYRNLAAPGTVDLVRMAVAPISP